MSLVGSRRRKDVRRRVCSCRSGWHDGGGASVALPRPLAELELLDEGREAAGAVVVADGRHGVGLGGARVGRVLDVEDGLAGVEEGPEVVALVELEALLVDLELDPVQHAVDDGAAVLEPDGEIAGVALVGQEADVVGGVVVGQVQARVVVVGVDVVRVDAVAALAHGLVEPVAHDVAHVGRARVEPPLAIPALEGIGVVLALAEPVRVGSEVLVAAGGEVADHLAAHVVQVVDDGLVVGEEVDVVHRRRVRRVVEGLVQHDVPVDAGLGPPDLGRSVRSLFGPVRVAVRVRIRVGPRQTHPEPDGQHNGQDQGDDDGQQDLPPS